jgi:tetratricopeptide (TPR) repeat protein
VAYPDSDSEEDAFPAAGPVESDQKENIGVKPGNQAGSPRAAEAVPAVVFNVGTFVKTTPPRGKVAAGKSRRVKKGPSPVKAFVFSDATNSFNEPSGTAAAAKAKAAPTPYGKQRRKGTDSPGDEGDQALPSAGGAAPTVPAEAAAASGQSPKAGKVAPTPFGKRRAKKENNIGASDERKQHLEFDASDAHASEPDHVCEMCEDYHTATHRCIQCAQFMCTSLSKVHAKCKATRDHDMQTIAEFRSGIEGPTEAPMEVESPCRGYSPAFHIGKSAPSKRSPGKKGRTSKLKSASSAVPRASQAPASQTSASSESFQFGTAEAPSSGAQPVNPAPLEHVHAAAPPAPPPGWQSGNFVFQQPPLSSASVPEPQASESATFDPFMFASAAAPVFHMGMGGQKERKQAAATQPLGVNQPSSMNVPGFQPSVPVQVEIPVAAATTAQAPAPASPPRFQFLQTPNPEPAGAAFPAFAAPLAESGATAPPPAAFSAEPASFAFSIGGASKGPKKKVGSSKSSQSRKAQHSSSGPRAGVQAASANQAPAFNAAPTPAPAAELQERASKYKMAGGKLYAEGQYLDAARMYTNAIDSGIPPSEFSAILFANRAAAYHMLQRYKLVIADCMTAVAHWPPFTKAYLRMAKAHLILGDTQLAKRAYMDADSRAHGSSAEAMALDAQQGLLQVSTLEKNKKLMANANLLGDFAAVLTYVSHSLMIAPMCKKLQLMKVETFFRGKQWTEAVEFCERTAQQIKGGGGVVGANMESASVAEVLEPTVCFLYSRALQQLQDSTNARGVLHVLMRDAVGSFATKCSTEIKNIDAVERLKVVLSYFIVVRRLDSLCVADFWQRIFSIW